MLGTLWRTGLLLSFIRFCTCLEEKCVLGIVGHPTSLPCFYPELLTFANVSIEWRRDGEVVLRSGLEADGNLTQWSINNATISADALLTGNLSLEIPTADPKEDNMFYSLFIISEKNESAPLCTKCLRIAGRFSSPLLQRVEAEQGTETTFVCHSSGGFPEPAVYWLIDDTEEPPEGSVTTQAVSHPDSHLYNITSHLTASISKDSSVSCIIDNKFMNETLTSMSYGLRSSKVVSRASEAMWIFSTVLCVLVGVLVIVGVVYQIHQDRMSKRKKYQDPDRGYRRRRLRVEETDMKTEPPESDL